MGDWCFVILCSLLMCVPPPPENGKQMGFHSIVLDNQSALNGNGWGKLQFHTTIIQKCITEIKINNSTVFTRKKGENKRLSNTILSLTSCLQSNQQSLQFVSHKIKSQSVSAKCRGRQVKKKKRKG